MDVYRYKALDTNGALREGDLEAGARAEALDQLHRRGLVPLELTADASAGTPRRSIIRVMHALLVSTRRPHLSLRDLVSATHSLAALLKAGLTVDRALSIAANLSTAAAARFFEDLSQTVRAGASFADALRATRLPLPNYYISMVDAGELGGSLPEALARASDLLKRNVDVKERMQSALFYPIILAFVVLGTLVVLIAFVLPRFRVLFAESQASLPWSTGLVLGLGELIARYWWVIVSLLAGGLIAARQFATSNAGKLRIDRWLLQSRWTLSLPAAIDTARMLRTLSTLLQNGVPLSAALRVSQGTLSNASLRAALESVTRRVNAGEDFAISMASARVFPREAVQLARVGEESGRLHELLAEAASILEANAARTLERLFALMVPAVTLFMGFIVAALIGSVLVGLLSINELAS